MSIILKQHWLLLQNFTHIILSTFVFSHFVTPFLHHVIRKYSHSFFKFCKPCGFISLTLSRVSFPLLLSFVQLWITGTGRAATMMNKRELEKGVKYLYLVAQSKPPNTLCTLSLSLSLTHPHTPAGL